jgi:hypothetical protein
MKSETILRSIRTIIISKEVDENVPSLDKKYNSLVKNYNNKVKITILSGFIFRISLATHGIPRRRVRNSKAR